MIASPRTSLTLWPLRWQGPASPTAAQRQGASQEIPPAQGRAAQDSQGEFPGIPSGKGDVWRPAGKSCCSSVTLLSSQLSGMPEATTSTLTSLSMWNVPSAYSPKSMRSFKSNSDRSRPANRLRAAESSCALPIYCDSMAVIYLLRSPETN